MVQPTDYSKVKLQTTHIAGGTYFITQVTYQRQPCLCSEVARTALRVAIESVRQHYPFSIDAFVLLPDHFHCIWTLPPADSDYSTRLRLIKGLVTKQCGNQLALPLVVCASRQKRGERNLWQRRFWEHLIRDEEDFARHCDYFIRTYATGTAIVLIRQPLKSLAQTEILAD